MKTKTTIRMIIFALVISLLAGSLCGCAGVPSGEVDTDTDQPRDTAPDTAKSGVDTAETEPSETDEPDRTAERGLPISDVLLYWTYLNKEEKESYGYTSPETISFLCMVDGQYDTVTVSREEVYASAASDRPFPRTHYYDDLIPGIAEEVFPVIDYCMKRGYSRFTIPAVGFTGSELKNNLAVLDLIYGVNQEGFSMRDTGKEVTLEDGSKVCYVTLLMPGIFGMVGYSRFCEALREVYAVIDGIPEGFDEEQKALYLYKYLTDNVVYNDEGYYDTSMWDWFYDAMIKKYTVCAGYACALSFLYNGAGIDCINVTGKVKDETDTSHMWNCAEIGGKYYLFDPTWDAGYGTMYEYFAVSQDQLDKLSPRRIEEGEVEKALPECGDCLLTPIPERDTKEVKLVYFGLLSDGAVRQRPEALLRLLGLTGGRAKKRGETEDGWIITDLPYKDMTNKLWRMLSNKLRDRLLDGAIRNEGGYVAYNPDFRGGDGYRLGGVKYRNGGWHATVQELGEDYRFTERDAVFKISDNGSYYVLDKVEFSDGSGSPLR
ncbi:MAG: hypothetical protein IJR90_04715 [Clostridia bacterium]|nr:hypothetical protein [Clostridia bacterium]